jgi:glutaconate CoA-transferase subunit B
VGRTIIFMQHEKRKFVRNVDYLTSPGWLDGPLRREELGLKPGGPSAVITNMAIMGFDAESKEMFLNGFFPGISPAKIQAHMSFEVDVSRAVEVPEPSKSELQILRDVCDPQRLILGV